MPTLQQIMNRARSLRNETALNSISPERAGSIMYDTLAYMNQMQLEGANPLLICKIYDSVASMEADTDPVSDLDGSAILPGQIVCIVTGDPDDPEDGLVYRYDGTEDDTSSWTAVGRIGSAPYLEGFLYMGKAVLTPTPTDPGAPTQKVFYTASQPGTYGYFGNIVVNDGEVVNLKWDGTGWLKDVTGAASGKALDEKVAISVGKNLLDMESPGIIANKFINASGEIAVGSAPYKVSDLIAVEPNTDYHLSNETDGYIGKSGYVAFFDAGLSLVGTPVNTKQFTTPAGASFLRCTIHEDESAKAMLNKGTERGIYEPFNPVGGYTKEIAEDVKEIAEDVDGLLESTSGLPQQVEKIRKNEDIVVWTDPQIINKNLMEIVSNLRSGVATLASNTKGLSFDQVLVPFVSDDASQDYTLVIGQTDTEFSSLYQIVNDALTTAGNILVTKTTKLGTTLGYTAVLLDEPVRVTKKFVAIGVYTASGSHAKAIKWTDSTGKAESNFVSLDNGESWIAYVGGAETTKYGAFPVLLLENRVKNDISRLNETVGRLVRNFPGGLVQNDSVAAGEEISIDDFPYYAKDRDNVSFSARFASFNKLLIGRGYQANHGIWLEIDSENVKIMRHYNSADQVLSTQAHGLTMATFVKVLYSWGEDGKLTYIIQSLAGYFKYTYNTVYYGGMGKAFASPVGADMSACELSAYNSGEELRVWVFGDSYVAVQNNTRWPYYLADWGFTRYEIFGLSGGGSNSLYGELTRALAFGVPKFALWGLGMNDGSDADINTPATVWKTNASKFLAMCQDRGITPILATIPTVPSIYNEAKNKWVRESGHRYVDFAKAVGAQADGTWYEGMISTDNVHPTQIGGQALATQVLVDFPEIMR